MIPQGKTEKQVAVTASNSSTFGEHQEKDKTSSARFSVMPGGTFMVAGTAIGAGMLGLPVRTAAGMLKISSNYSVQWQGDAASKKSLKGGSCETHWWGEKCKVSSSTTKKICTGLETGEGALLICSLIPVVDAACEIIELIGSIPLEAEICPCASKGTSSTFNVTWVGACWFKCD